MMKEGISVKETGIL